MLGGAVDDRPHAFLDRHVLRVDAFNAREVLVLLLLAIDEIVVGSIGLQPKIWIEVVRVPAILAFTAGRRADRARPRPPRLRNSGVR
jgi:hypothetical protein